MIFPTPLDVFGASGPGSTSLAYPPRLTVSDNDTGTSFNVNFSPGKNNTGKYLLDVYKASDFTYAQHDQVVAALVKSVTGIAQLTDYKVRARAVLNTAAVPLLRDSWDHEIMVYETGSGHDISDAYAAITDASDFNVYRLITEPGKTFNEHLIQMKPNIDLYISDGTVVTYSGSTDVNQDLIYSGGKNMLFGSGAGVGIQGELRRNVDLTDGGHCYCLRYWQNVVGDFFVYGLTMHSTGTDSGGALEIDFSNNGGRVFLLNLFCTSQNTDVLNLHNQPDSTGQLFIENVNAVQTNPFASSVGWANYGGAGAPPGFVHIKGCTVGKISSGNGTYGVNETSFYIDPTTSYTSLSFAAPATNLSLIDFNALLTDNELMVSGYSSTITVSVPAVPHVLPFDGQDNVVALVSKDRKFMTKTTGNLLTIRNATTGVSQSFGFTGNSLNTSAITSFLAGADGYITEMYCGSTGRVFAQTDTSKQPKYVLGGFVQLQWRNDVTNLVTAASTDFVFTGDFCIAYYMKFIAPYGDYRNILSSMNSGGGNNGFWIQFGTGQGFDLYSNGAEPIFSNAPKTLDISVPHALQVSRVGSTIKLFIDGAQIASASYSGTIGASDADSNKMNLGLYANNRTDAINMDFYHMAAIKGSFSQAYVDEFFASCISNP